MISYRDADLADASILDRIFRISFCDTFAHLYGPQDLAAFLAGITVAHWETQLADLNYAFRLAEVDGVAAGYLKLGPFGKLPVSPTRDAMILDQLYILKEYHGTGLARDLMSWAIEEASRRRAEELYLTVYVDNHRARHFYDRYGFKTVGRFDFKVGNHVDEDLIMLKSL